MSVHTRFGMGLGLGVFFLFAAGCKTEDLTAMGEEGRFDKAALDMYMTDVSHNDPYRGGDSRPSIDVSVTSIAPTPGSNKLPAKSFFGDWEAKIDMKAEMEKEREKRKNDPNYDPSMEQFGEAFAEGMAQMMSFALSIKEDNSFMMTMMFFPVEGRWEQKGDTIWLHPEKVMGMSKEELAKMAGPDGKVDMKNDEPLVLRLSADGKTLTAHDPKGEFGSEELVFTRKAG